MSGRIEQGKNKAAFKKRAHRPWQPPILEEISVDHPNVLDVSAKLNHKQFELLQKQLQMTLDIKLQEKSELNSVLDNLDADRITLGGFLKPKNILLANETETLQKTALLINELKEKEFEIQSITQNLKITQAEEYAESAEKARLNEEKARHAAEEKAIFALKQANMAAEQIKKAEEKIFFLENGKAKLEKVLFDLEDKLKLATHELDVLGLKSNKNTEQKQKLEYDLRIAASALHNEKQNKKTLEEKLKLLSQDLNEKQEECRLTEMKLVYSSEQVYQLINSLAIERHRLNEFNMNLICLKENIEISRNEQTHIQSTQHEILENLHAAHFKIKLMEQVIQAERNLRLLYEKRLSRKTKLVF